jgi:hypothetical protein
MYLNVIRLSMVLRLMSYLFQEKKSYGVKNNLHSSSDVHHCTSPHHVGHREEPIPEKNQRQKSSLYCPFKLLYELGTRPLQQKLLSLYVHFVSHAKIAVSLRNEISETNPLFCLEAKFFSLPFSHRFVSKRNERRTLHRRRSYVNRAVVFNFICVSCMYSAASLYSFSLWCLFYWLSLLRVAKKRVKHFNTNFFFIEDCSSFRQTVSESLHAQLNLFFCL